MRRTIFYFLQKSTVTPFYYLDESTILVLRSRNYREQQSFAYFPMTRFQDAVVPFDYGTVAQSYYYTHIHTL